VLDHFRSSSADAVCSGRLDVLLDLSETKSLPETHQLQSVGLTLGMMKMFAVFAEEHFRQIQVFRGAAEADAWLMSSQSAVDGEP
jgi:hypothetical protein